MNLPQIRNEQIWGFLREPKSDNAEYYYNILNPVFRDKNTLTEDVIICYDGGFYGTIWIKERDKFYGFCDNYWPDERTESDEGEEYDNLILEVEIPLEVILDYKKQLEEILSKA
jgi:hypothetical protein